MKKTTLVVFPRYRPTNGNTDVYFNPRTREGCDKVSRSRIIKLLFQSTHLCKCDNTVCDGPFHHEIFHFNPRTLYKGTVAHSCATVV